MNAAKNCLCVNALLAILVASGCGNPRESARRELAKLDKDFNADTFIQSVSDGDQVAVKCFVQAGFDVNTPGADGITALHIAALKGNAAIVKTLLDQGANPNAVVTAGDDRGMTPLMSASAGGSLEVVNLLVAKGVDVNVKDDRGLAALDYAEGQTNQQILTVLWDHGAPFVTDAELAKLLGQFRSDLFEKASQSMMAFQPPDECRKFIDEQLLNFQQEQRFTTNQMVQARVCAFRAVSDVVDKSAMFESIDAGGAAGASQRNEDTIKTYVEFLKELQSDPAVQSGALLEASELGEAASVKWLLDQHADPNSKDGQGMTSLMWAALKNQGSTVQVLLDARAGVNLKDHSGWTATMWAASQGCAGTLKMLLAKSPDLSAVNNDGKTALSIANALNHAEVAALLKAAGEKD